MEKLILLLKQLLTTLTILVSTLSPMPKFGAIETPQFQRIEREDLKSWNTALVEQIGPNKFETQLDIGQVNFLDSNNKWIPIDPALATTTNGFCNSQNIFETCLPLTASGTARIINNKRFDIESKSIIPEFPITQEITALGIVNVAGQLSYGDLGKGKTQYVLYQNAYPALQADLIYYIHTGMQPRLRKLIRFNNPQAITNDVILQFRLRNDDILDIFDKTGDTFSKWDKKLKFQTQDKIIFKKGITKRGFSIDKPSVWYFDSSVPKIVKQPINIGLESLGNEEYLLSKFIPASFLSSVPSGTVAWSDIDINVAPQSGSGGGNVTVDGIVYRNASGAPEAWATIIAGAGTTVDTVDANLYGFYFAGGGAGPDTWAYNVRHIKTFDLSVIGSGNTISSSTYYCIGFSKNDPASNAPTINVFPAQPANNNNIVTGDYLQTGNTQYSTAIAFADFSTSATNTFTMKTAAINQMQADIAGVFRFSTKGSKDVSSTTPAFTTGDTMMNCSNADNTTANLRPKLTITYVAAPAAVTPPNLEDSTWFQILWNWLIYPVYAKYD